MTQEALAVVARVEKKTLRRIDRGQLASLTFGPLLRVAAALGCRPCDIVPMLAMKPGKAGAVELAKRQRSIAADAAHALHAAERS